MRIVDPLIKELEFEAVSIRKMLARVPEKDFGWKPHPKSMSMGQLASHVADTLSWVKLILEQPVMNMGEGEYKPWLATSTAELTAHFEKHLAEALAALDKCSAADMRKKWALKSGDAVYMNEPRTTVMRGVIINHLIHHRGQLSVYLRLRDVPVPSIYGPSADEAS